jgi:peptidoglycan/xylan/chitin deacetylase (PgdA/CDA1 family)
MVPLRSLPRPTNSAVGPALLAPLRVPILMYHQVADRAGAKGSDRSLVVPPALFEAQMAALAQAGWHTITLRQLAEDLASERGEPPRTFVVTFDDGHRDGFTNAVPILQRFGFVGTFFVITGRVGHHGYLTPAELCELTQRGDEVANHTVDHVSLPTLSPARQTEEIAEAGAAIRVWTGVAPVTLAYPFGAWSLQVAARARQLGYLLAVTNREGDMEARWNRYTVPRLRVGPWTTAAGLVQLLQRCART